MPKDVDQASDASQVRMNASAPFHSGSSSASDTPMIRSSSTKSGTMPTCATPSKEMSYDAVLPDHGNVDWPNDAPVIGDVNG